MSLRSAYIVMLFFSFTSLLFASSPEYCHDKYMYRVKSLVDINSSSNETFDYFYQKRIKNNSKIVFIIIPGGPGGTSISKYNPDPQFPSFDFQEIQLGLPEGSNVIYTDPRSKGCNQENNLPASSFNSHNAANDILSIIKEEGLSQYIIVGHSYGTVVATILSDLISKTSLVEPLGVVLSGTLGKFFERDNRFYGYENAWKSFYETMPNELKELLPKTLIGADSFEFPFKISSKKWLNFLASGLNKGRVYTWGTLRYPLMEKLKILISGDVDKINKLKKEINSETGSNSYSDVFFNSIYCNEIEEGSKDCEDNGYTQFLRPFDSAEYQINSKIIYFQGELDPAVPLDRAQYHFNHQLSSKKILITLPFGGHITGFMINDCKKWFWSQFFLDDSLLSLADVTNKCPGNLSVRMSR